jgi:hypothetical protein
VVDINNRLGCQFPPRSLIIKGLDIAHVNRGIVALKNNRNAIFVIGKSEYRSGLSREPWAARRSERAHSDALTDSKYRFCIGFGRVW